MSNVRALLVGLVGAPILLLNGCQNDLFADQEAVAALAPGRVDQIEPATTDTLAPGEHESPDAALAEAMSRGFTPPVYDERREVQIDAVRAATLANNLDLKVERFNPTIGITRVNEEMAKFEATLFADYARNTTGAFTSLEEGTPTATDSGDLGVSVPLATGGTLSASTLLNYSDSSLNSLVGAEPWEAGLSFSVSQPLLRGAGVANSTASIRIAKLQGQAIDARTKMETIRILANADRAYWNLYRAVRQFDVRVRQHEVSKAQLERARRRVAAGDAAEIEVIRAESGVGSTIEQIIVADNAVRLRQRDLKRLMNDPSVGLESPTALLPKSEPNPLGLNIQADRLVQNALANRMEMLELELQLTIDETNIAGARNAALPLFTVDFDYQLLGDDTSLGSAWSSLGNSDGYTAGVTARIPLGNEAAEARVSRAIATRLQRLASREARIAVITQETLNAADTVRNAWQRILAARLETALAGRTFEAEQRQFEVGLRTSTDVLDAAARLADAQSREVDALAGYEIALVDLSFATGTLLGGARIDLESEPVPSATE